MANVDNDKRDASGYSINDYKAIYEQASRENNAEVMQWANNGANAIRTNQGGTAEYANVAIANAAAAGRTPATNTNPTTLNERLHDGTDSDKSKFNAALHEQIAYGNANPDVTKGFTQDEFKALYGNVQSPTAQGYTIGQMYDIGAAGQYTYDKAEADYAASQGYTVAQTTYNGKPAYMITPNENTSRTQHSGTSGADESLLNSQQYAAVQYEKQQWSNYDTLYRQALAAGNTALANQYLAARDQSHANAERIRASAWLGSYSGGKDGSTYLTYGELANPDTYDFFGKNPYVGDNVYADAIGQTQSYRNNAATTPSVTLPSSGTVTGSQSGTTGTTTQTPTVTTPSTTTPSLELPSLPDIKSQVNDYSQYIEEMYKAKQEAAIAALESAYQQNVNELNRAGEGLEQTYQNARNQTAGAAELSARNFAEIAAANGLNSGATGQAALARSVTLQNNMNSINQQEAQSIASLELQRANLTTEYNNAIAQAEAEGNYQLANALYQEKVRYEEALNAALQQEWQNAMTKWQAEYQVNRDAVSDAQWQAQFDFMVRQWEEEMAFQKEQYYGSMAGTGSSGSYSGGSSGYTGSYDYNSDVADNSGYTINDYKEIYAMAREEGNAELMQWANDGANAIRNALGIASEYANVDIANVAGTKTISNNNTTKPNTKTTSKSTSTGSGVSYNNGSLTSSQVKDLQAVYGLDQDGYWGPNSQATSGMSADKAYASQNGTGMNDSYFRQAMTTIATQIDQGKTEQAVSGIDSIWDRLTVNQKAQVQNSLKGFDLSYTP